MNLPCTLSIFSDKVLAEPRAKNHYPTIFPCAPQNYFFVSLWGMRLRQNRQYLFNSIRSGFFFLSLVLL